MGDNKVALTRLSKELDLRKNPPIEISMGPVADNLFYWEGVLYGPRDRPYEGGYFKFRVNFTSSYPMSPSEVKFVTRIYDPMC
jgi:ubiquitin-protein ligase